MHYRSLGRTGFTVSIIGFGASPLGGVFGQVGQEEGTAAVLHAIDYGINLFDVSPYYGHTLAEQRLGAALHNRRHQVVLATKCGRYGAHHFDFSAATVTREFEASLRRLRTDYVDLLQVHDVEFGAAAQILDETLPALRTLQQQGKVRSLGITGYWPGRLARLAETAAEAAAPLDTVLNYCHFNLLMDDMDRELTPTLRELGTGLLNASPLHMGLLAGAAAPAWHPAPPAVQTAAAQVAALTRSFGLNPATLAIHACLQHSYAASTLVGLSSVAQVDDTLRALTLQPPAALLASIRRLAGPIFNMGWPSGQPADQPTPLYP